MNTEDVSQENAGCIAEHEITVTDVKWAALIPITVGLALVIWLFIPTFKWWYGMWMKDESYYSHGFLVPLISGFIVWLKRDILKRITIKPAVHGFTLLFAALIVTSVASWVDTASIRGLMFPAVIAGLCLAILGRKMTKELSFPISYLYFMCVLPGFALTMLSFRIQMLSTIGATMLLRILTFDAYREGAMIMMPNTEVLVGAPCSGFRLLISLFAFSTLFVYLKEGPLWGKGLIVAMTLPLSLVLNALRIAMIAIVGELLGKDAMHSFHNFSGYIILILAFVILYLFARVVKCQKFNSTLIS